jgi:hypothetical protein
METSLQSLCNEILEQYDTSNAPQMAQQISLVMQGFLVAARTNDQLYRQCFMTLMELITGNQYKRVAAALLQNGPLALALLRQLPLVAEKHVEVWEMDYRGDDRYDERVHSDGHYYGSGQCRERDCTQCHSIFALPPRVLYMQVAQQLGSREFDRQLLSSAVMTVRNYCVLLSKPGLIGALYEVIEHLFELEPVFDHEKWFGEEEQEVLESSPEFLRQLARRFFRYLYEQRYTLRLDAPEDRPVPPPALNQLLTEITRLRRAGRLPLSPLSPHTIVRERLHGAFTRELNESEALLRAAPYFPLDASGDPFHLLWFLYNGPRSLYAAQRPSQQQCLGLPFKCQQCGCAGQ